MPKTVATPRQLIDLCNRTDANWIKVKKISGDVTKFKLRTTKYLYTLTVRQAKFAALVNESIPNTLEIIHVAHKEILNQKE
jgi:large subunit ribosomal protein L38e